VTVSVTDPWNLSRVMPVEGGAHVIVVSSDPGPAGPSAVVLASGDPLPASLLADTADAIDRAELVVAADGGLQHAHRAGRDVDVLVGDLDSVTSSALERARRAGTEVIVHPSDKSMTDLDLALGIVLERLGASVGTAGVPEVLVVGGHGGRLDHLLGNLLVLASDRYAGLRISAWSGTDVVHLVRDVTTVHGDPGAAVSLLALHGPARGVTTTGLRFPLDDALLEPGSSLGISNEIVESPATVRVQGGVLAAIRTA